MKNLTVLENDLVPVYETSTGEKVVYGTELHAVLEVKSNYRDWVKNRLSDSEAIENEDYEAAKILAPSGQVMKEHIIKLDTAKEMAMLERNDKGKQVRRHFIKVEKKYKELKQNPLSAIEQLHNVAIMEVETKVEAVNKELQEFKLNMPILGVETDQITEAVHRRIVNTLGGKKSNAYNDRSLRGRVCSDIYRELKRQFDVKSYKAIKRSQCNHAISVINKYEMPFVLAEQVKDCNAQINMEEV